jgi:hypothetical protein
MGLRRVEIEPYRGMTRHGGTRWSLVTLALAMLAGAVYVTGAALRVASDVSTTRLP